MQRLEVSGAVRHIYIYVIRRLKVNETGASCVCTVEAMNSKENELSGTQPVEGTRKMVNAYILVGKPEGKKPLWTSRHRWETAQLCVKQ
jgi:hypothetical protein